MFPSNEEHRPWGFYRVLCEEPDHKIKYILVYPGHRSSLQKHGQRNEHWHVIQGKMTVRIGESDILLKKGDSIDIPIGTIHRMINNGNVNSSFIEVQTGDYFGEDDIERIEDDYGRI